MWRERKKIVGEITDKKKSSWKHLDLIPALYAVYWGRVGVARPHKTQWTHTSVFFPLLMFDVAVGLLRRCKHTAWFVRPFWELPVEHAASPSNTPPNMAARQTPKNQDGRREGCYLRHLSGEGQVNLGQKSHTRVYEQWHMVCEAASPTQPAGRP